jgi:phosphoribosylaminoimidazolecarboxamide formyltransferase/IMP cyclohydrolase
MTDREGQSLGQRPIRRALISVYDKTGLADLARGLHDAGVAIVSTGSTAKTIAASGVPVTSVEDVTGFPEVLDGRVKTLHPRVHAACWPTPAAGTLALEELGVAAFELVVVNLYPFTETVESGASEDECVEQIDIGGPSMARRRQEPPQRRGGRRAARVRRRAGRGRSGGFTLAERKSWRRQLPAPPSTTSRWRAGWARPWPRAADVSTSLPQWFAGTWRRASVLRYGENPHRRPRCTPTTPHGPGSRRPSSCTVRRCPTTTSPTPTRHGGPPSTEGICVAIIKRASPCGIAVSSVSVADAHRKATVTR